MWSTKLSLAKPYKPSPVRPMMASVASSSSAQVKIESGEATNDIPHSEPVTDSEVIDLTLDDVSTKRDLETMAAGSSVVGNAEKKTKNRTIK